MSLHWVLQRFPVLLELGSAELDAALQIWLHQDREEGKRTSLDLLPVISLVHYQSLQELLICMARIIWIKNFESVLLIWLKLLASN